MIYVRSSLDVNQKIVATLGRTLYMSMYSKMVSVLGSHLSKTASLAGPK